MENGKSGIQILKEELLATMANDAEWSEDGRYDSDANDYYADVEQSAPQEFDCLWGGEYA